LTASEIYDGESYDYTASDETPKPARSMSRPSTRWISPEAPSVRRQQVLPAIKVVTTPTGKKVLDFGQNLVGFARIIKSPPSNSTLTLKHAEVMERQELGTRPLRICKATDVIKIGNGSDAVGHEPKFTFHGFRYLQVEGWEDVSADCFEAVVIYSDMERTGDFECSHSGLSRYHLNTLWGLRGNFVSVPTDCPQRDERLGWTGDLQAFCSTASYLYDTMGLLGNWLEDVAVEQLAKDNDQKGVPPITVPNILPIGIARFAIWGDVTAHAPNDLYAAFGDRRVLEDQWESMTAWVDHGVLRAESGLWTNDQWQLGDWLDPTAPDDAPGDTHSDGTLVANCFLLKTIEILAYIGSVLGKPDGKRYQDEYATLLKAFQGEYITPNGLITSDTQTTLALALHFNLVPEKGRKYMAERLVLLIRKKLFKISTGFAGTPVILLALVETGHLDIAYRMFQEKQCPSLLYPISMGATTIWERWNSMLPDGSINPGEMTSFNHYALGSVSRFLYEKTGGLSILEPGWKKALIAPQPGGTVTHASVSHVSGYGKHECKWRNEGDRLKVEIKVPPNTTARVVLPGIDEDVGSGSRTYSVDWKPDPNWPPKIWHFTPVGAPPLDEVVE
jgi:alpha-L-rhamnosidase